MAKAKRAQINSLSLYGNSNISIQVYKYAYLMAMSKVVHTPLVVGFNVVCI